MINDIYCLFEVVEHIQDETSTLIGLNTFQEALNYINELKLFIADIVDFRLDVLHNPPDVNYTINLVIYVKQDGQESFYSGKFEETILEIYSVK